MNSYQQDSRDDDADYGVTYRAWVEKQIINFARDGTAMNDIPMRIALEADDLDIDIPTLYMDYE